MAGTRLAIQTIVLVHLLGLLWVSLYYGFCRSSCKRGNLSKIVPLVPGLVDKTGGATTANGAVVEAQFWEEIIESVVCLPIKVVFGAILATTPPPTTTAAVTAVTAVADDTTPEEDYWWYVMSAKLDMTLVVENATELPLWIEMLSEELRGGNDEEYDDNDDGDDDGEGKPLRSTFSTLLHKNPMGLEIVPPLASPVDNDDSIDPSVFLSHYKLHGGSIATTAEATQSSSEREQQRKLVLYIPASMAILPEETETIGWRAFDTKSSGKETTMASATVTTMVLPTAPGTTAASSELQPLVEDWMARSIEAQQQQQHRRKRKRKTQEDPARNNNSNESSNNESTVPPKKIRLTREFAIEHFLAVMMPLIFPLILPFFVSWIKEVKRYKKLTKAKKERLEKTANDTKTSASAATPSSKTKAE